MRGRLWTCPGGGGVDIACEAGTLRLRYCLDSERRVRLFGTGVIGGDLVRAEVFCKSVKVEPSKHRDVVRRCVRASQGVLRDELRRYLLTFEPGVRRLLDVSRWLPASRTRQKKRTTRQQKTRRPRRIRP